MYLTVVIFIQYMIKENHIAFLFKNVFKDISMKLLKMRKSVHATKILVMLKTIMKTYTVDVKIIKFGILVWFNNLLIDLIVSLVI